MLETGGCVTESETGLTDTAEPAAAGETREQNSILFSFSAEGHNSKHKTGSTLLNRKSLNRTFTFY